MQETPSEIGARTELEVSHALYLSGWAVYLPVFCAHSRVDLVAVRTNETLRVQCKTARLAKNVLYFRTCSNTKNRPKPYHGEVAANNQVKGIRYAADYEIGRSTPPKRLTMLT